MMRDILQAVDSDVDFPLKQCPLDLLDKKALAADLKQRNTGDVVSEGSDLDDLGVKLWERALQG